MQRYNTKKACPTCTARTSVLAAPIRAEWKVDGYRLDVFVTEAGAVVYNYIIGSDEALVVPCRGCGRARVARKVCGKVRADKTCDGRCEAATGHNCECACGGVNHGKAHTATPVAPVGLKLANEQARIWR